MDEDLPEAIALPRGDGYELTGLARGPWQPDAAHGGAPAALIVREVERHGRDEDMRLASLSLTFFGPVMLGEVELESEVIKPGRRQKVVAAKLGSNGRTAIEARAVLLRRAEIEFPDTVVSPQPELRSPEEGGPVDPRLWTHGSDISFHRTANTIRTIEGGPEVVGANGSAWFHLDHPLVPGEEPSPVQRAVAAADFGNGLAHPVSFDRYLFVNCDLNVSIFRDPADEWIGLRSRTDADSNGSGLTITELHDRNGRFGTATQALYVDYR